MPPANEAVALENVWKFYGDYAALRDFTLIVARGACCAIFGRNGAGKTTLLRIAAGLCRFDRGVVRVLGGAPRGQKVRRETGFLGHGIGVYEDLSARENLDFFARLTGVEKASSVVDAWLERVGLTKVSGMPVRQFSRGMRQRLALARAFLHAPRVLLLDEPFTSLDDRATAILTQLLQEARQRDATIVLSTHQIREALAISTHVALIENGRLRYQGERTEAMLADPGLLYRLHAQSGAA